MGFLSEEDAAELRRMLDGASIVVTGGTGSFGHAFTRRLFDVATPRRIIVLSRDELKQFEMQNETPYRGRETMRFFIGDVRDEARLEIAFHDVDYVIHAAALKHVPIAEYNPFECIKTNVIGAENVIRAAMSNRVKRVVALSTDKACNPVNLYGASKLASDKLFVAANAMSGSTRVRFSVVRYGNVLGSRGSVVPFFRKLLDDNAASLPITDTRMTRFIITLRQGVDCVLSSLVRMRGGEIFVPKIPSVKVTDIAEAMSPGIKLDEVGTRPGEKLHEAMISEEEADNVADLGDRYAIEPQARTFARRSFLEDGWPGVPDRFGYYSAKNEHWLDSQEFRKLLQEQGFV